MKNRIIVCMTAALAMTAPITGCGSTDKASAPQTVETEPASEAAPSDTKTPDASETAGTESSYSPASFKADDVYVSPDQTPTIDITGCDTFTQIVDRLEDGRGYANVTLGDTDVLLVSSGTYEYDPGVNAAIDAEIYYYKDNAPAYLATLSAGGTAYPLSLKDGNIYVGGNHFMSKFLADSGNLIETEEAYVLYDTDGYDTYYYKTCNSQFEDYDEATAKNRFEELFKEQQEAEIISFQPVG